jgi:hypothetical protein
MAVLALMKRRTTWIRCLLSDDWYAVVRAVWQETLYDARGSKSRVSERETMTGASSGALLISDIAFAN